MGGTYRGYAPQLCAQRTINLFPYTVSAQGTKVKRALLNVPGKRRFGTLADRPGRGIFFQDGRCFGVAGTTLFQIHADGTSTVLGSVAPSGNPAMFAGNGARGNQIMVVSSSLGYIWNTSTSTFAQIVDTSFPANVVTCGYLDGYFVVITRDRFGISTSLDGTSWGGDEGQRVGAPENLIGGLIDHEVLWLAGATQTEVWSDTGAAAFPIEPLTGVFLEYGLEAAYAICRLGDSIAWLCSDERGGRKVMRNQGYNAVPISHEGINAALSALPSVADARMWSYEIHGHVFAVLTIPSQRLTLQYDATESEWSELAFFNTDTGQYEADRSSCHAYAFGKHLCLDRESGDIWELSMDVYADGDHPRRWMRVSPTISDENRMVFYHRAELDGAVGVGLTSGSGSEPIAELRFSDDAGQTWGNAALADVGAIGNYDQRPQWWMLGSARNRAYELSGTDPVQVVINDLLLDVTRGAH